MICGSVPQQGSLCFGSLLVAVLHVAQLIRKMLNARNPASSLMAAKHGGGFLSHVLDTCECSNGRLGL